MICATHIFNCHFHKYIPQLHTDSNKVTCLKLGPHIPEWPNRSLSGVNQPPFHVDKRYRGAEGNSAKEFVNSSGEKGQTKNLLWAAVRARFSACSGVAVKCLFQQHSFFPCSFYLAIESKNVMYIKMLCLSDGVHFYSGTILLTDR